MHVSNVNHHFHGKSFARHLVSFWAFFFFMTLFDVTRLKEYSCK